MIKDNRKEIKRFYRNTSKWEKFRLFFIKVNKHTAYPDHTTKKRVIEYKILNGEKVYYIDKQVKKRKYIRK